MAERSKKLNGWIATSSSSQPWRLRLLSLILRVTPIAGRAKELGCSPHRTFSLDGSYNSALPPSYGGSALAFWQNRDLNMSEPVPTQTPDSQEGSARKPG